MTPNDQLKQFLEEQQSLSDPLILEPVVITKRDRVTISPGARIDSFVKIEGGDGVHIGHHVHIASFAHINIGGGEVDILDYAAVASGGKVIGGSNQIDAISMSAVAGVMQRVERKRTVLKKYSCVLSGAIVLPGVTLEEGAVLAAGGVATRDIPAWEVWGGVPAKFIKKREVK